MKNLNVTVSKKVATYTKRDGAIVCGNRDYQITFAFDSEWSSYLKKTARFKWNGGFKDVEFWGNFVNVPIIENATQVEVGVYVDDLSTTTPALIPCTKSILCGAESEYISHEEAHNIQERLSTNDMLTERMTEHFILTKSSNLFNQDGVKLNTFLDNTTGEEKTYDGAFVTDFVEVAPLSRLCASVTVNGMRGDPSDIGASGPAVYQYDVAKRFISRKSMLQDSSKRRVATLDAGTKYVRFADISNKLLASNVKTCIKVVEDPYLTYEPYYEGERWMPKGFVASRSSGLDAYEVACQFGFVGGYIEWLESLVGPAGPKGEDGFHKEHHITIKKDPTMGGTDASFEAHLLLYFRDLGYPVTNRLDKILDCLKHAKIHYVYEWDSTDGERMPAWLEWVETQGVVRVWFYNFSSTDGLTRGYFDALPTDITVTDDVKEVRYYDGN